MHLRGSWHERECVQDFMLRLTELGYKVLFVGGCIRDDLLGEEIADIDISTSASPSKVIDVAASLGFKTVPKGIRYGTVLVVPKNFSFEVTSFRRDVSTDGRYATVAYHDDLAEDARRRDFTINAIYADRHGRILDPIEGIPDLKARRVRFVGDPKERIAEDYLRMLRFFRMGALFGDPEKGLDLDGLQAINDMASRVNSLSRERIGQELLGLMAAPNPASSVEKMVQTGIWEMLLPGSESKFLRELVDLERQHGVYARRGCIDAAIRRLATIGSASLADKLRISRKLQNRWQNLRKAIDSRLGAAALAHELGAIEARDAVLVRAAVGGIAIESNFEFEIARGSKEQFPVRPRDLMPELQGAALGGMLSYMKKEWLASGLELTGEELLKMKSPE